MSRPHERALRAATGTGRGAGFDQAAQIPQADDLQADAMTKVPDGTGGTG